MDVQRPDAISGISGGRKRGLGQVIGRKGEWGRSLCPQGRIPADGTLCDRLWAPAPPASPLPHLQHFHHWCQRPVCGPSVLCIPHPTSPVPGPQPQPPLSSLWPLQKFELLPGNSSSGIPSSGALWENSCFSEGRVAKHTKSSIIHCCGGSTGRFGWVSALVRPSLQSTALGGTAGHWGREKRRKVGTYRNLQEKEECTSKLMTWVRIQGGWTSQKGSWLTRNHR